MAADGTEMLYCLHFWLPMDPTKVLHCLQVQTRSSLASVPLLGLGVWGFSLSSRSSLFCPSFPPPSLFSHAFSLSLSLPLWFALSHASLSPSHSLLTVSLSSLSLSDPLPESPRIWHRQLTVAVAVPRSPKWRVAMAQSFVATPLPHGRPNEIASRRP